MPYPLEVLAWIAAGLTGIGIVWSKGIVPTAAWIRSVIAQIRKAAKIIDTLSGIADQFQPNGGHSLHDKISRIEADVLEVKRDTEALKHSVKVVQEEEMAALNLMLAQVLSDTGEMRALDPPTD